MSNNTSISFPAGAMGPGMTPPFLVSSLIPGQGGVTGEYGDINVAPEELNQRVGPVRSPLGPVSGYRDQTAPLGPLTLIPSNIPGPIYPGVGPGSWHVGPTVVRRGKIPYGPYSRRFRRKDRKFRTYGADIPEEYYEDSKMKLAQAAVGGAVLGLFLRDLGVVKGAIAGATIMLANQLFWGLTAKMAPEVK